MPQKEKRREPVISRNPAVKSKRSSKRKYSKPAATVTPAYNRAFAEFMKLGLAR